MPRKAIWNKQQRATIARLVQGVLEEFEGEVSRYGEYLPEGKVRVYDDGSVSYPRQSHSFTEATYQTRVGRWRVSGSINSQFFSINTCFLGQSAHSPLPEGLAASFCCFAGSPSPISRKWNALLTPNEVSATDEPLTKAELLVTAELLADALREAFVSLEVPLKVKVAA